MGGESRRWRVGWKGFDERGRRCIGVCYKNDAQVKPKIISHLPMENNMKDPMSRLPSLYSLSRRSRRAGDVLGQSLLLVLAHHLSIFIQFGGVKGDTRLNPMTDLTGESVVGL